MEILHTVGRRKTAIARAYLKAGNGVIIINNKDYKEYFPTLKYQSVIEEAGKLTATINNYDIKVTVTGGGITGQAEAVRHAIARALVELNEEYKDVLKKNGLLKRDPRMVERKKPGKPKARKNFQFRKR